MLLFSFEVVDLFPFSLPFSVADLNKVNIIIGQSSSGKTILLKAIQSLFLSTNENINIGSPCVLSSASCIAGVFHWNNITPQVKVPLRAVRNNVITQNMQADSSLPDAFILEHEKITPFFFMSDRTIDIKCTEIQNFSTIAHEICHEIITDYSIDFESKMASAVKALCADMPIELKPRFNFKKALSFEVHYDCNPSEKDEIIEFSALSSGTKKMHLLNFMLDRAEKNSSNPIFIDNIEAFFDKNQLQCVLHRLSNIKNQVFITTSSKFVCSFLDKNVKHIICSPQQDEMRSIHPNQDYYYDQFLY